MASSARKNKKAPPGCYWRGDVLYGQVKVGGRKHQWCLHTSDPVAAIRLREEKRKELSDFVHLGIEPARTIDRVILEWAPHGKRNLAPKTAERYACSLKQLEP